MKDQLIEWLQVGWPYLLCSVLGGLFFLGIKKWIVGYRIRKRLARGREKELEAVEWLESNGFRILDHQPQYQHAVKWNGRRQVFNVRPDFLVRKRGQTILVEVKSGSSAISIENRSTRRQLLEYHIVAPKYDLYLLDMEAGQLNKVDFSISSKVRLRLWKWGFICSLLMWLILFIYLLFSDDPLSHLLR